MRFATEKTMMSRRVAIYLFLYAVSFWGCGGAHEETVGGINVPVPGGMTKSEEKSIELSLPGFGGAQAAYQGKLDPDKVVEFYKKEMPARGWQPSMGVLSKGGMLSYAKESKSVVVMVGKNDTGTRMTITVGGSQR
jgi:hypothetical protein